MGHLDAVDVADDVEQAQRGAGAYVRAQRSRDSARACSVVAEQSAAEEKVGAWAVNETRARGAEQLELFGAEVDPMREAALSGAQAKRVIHLGVACVLGEQAAHPSTSSRDSLRWVCMRVSGWSLGFRSLEHLARAARRKARKHGVAKRTRATELI